MKLSIKVQSNTAKIAKIQPSCNLYKTGYKSNFLKNLNNYRYKLISYKRRLFAFMRKLQHFSYTRLSISVNSFTLHAFLQNLESHHIIVHLYDLFWEIFLEGPIILLN